MVLAQDFLFLENTFDRFAQFFLLNELVILAFAFVIQVIILFASLNSKFTDSIRQFLFYSLTSFVKFLALVFRFLIS